MIRDAVRALLAVVVMAVAAALVVEARYQMAAIDVAHRAAIDIRQPLAAQPTPPQTVAGQPGPLRRLGRATLDLADAALGVVR